MDTTLDFSIVIPVFNREDLTQQCLATLPPTLVGAGTGEVIVVDNGSEPATAAVLAAHPWVRVIRNERNLGFAAACNQGTRAAQGRYVVHLNNDTVGHPGWLAAMLRVFAEEPNCGVVGARLLFPDGTLQHAGVVAAPTRLGPEGFGPYHFLWKWPGDTPAALVRTDYDCVTGACLVMDRDVYLELGGFDEVYWNGYEDVDLCYKARARGLRVIYEPTAVLVHYESQSGIQRKRRVLHNIRELAERWRDVVVPDHNRWAERVGFVRRDQVHGGTSQQPPLPAVTLLVHGAEPSDPDAWLAHVLGARCPIAEVLWCAEGRVPRGRRRNGEASRALAAATERRGDRYLAIVETSTVVERDWLNDLIDTIEYESDICAAVVVDDAEFDAASMPLAADARCTLLALRTFPMHLAVDPTFATIGGSTAAFTAAAVRLGRAIRAVRRPTARLGPGRVDDTFAERFGTSLAVARRADPLRLEELSQRRNETVALSVVIVTRNLAVQAANAIRSLREFVSIPYELIVVDNGSDAAAREAIAAIPEITMIALPRDIGAAGARNLGAARATGSHLCFLDDDVVVTPYALESLVAAFADDGLLGMTAPITNNGEPEQTRTDRSYGSMDELLALARERTIDFAGYRGPTDVVGGFCMCVSRTAWEVVGGFDASFPSGTFEAEDFCLRLRSAGYAIGLCQDAFVHHAGGAAILANGGTYPVDRTSAWPLLARKFDLGTRMPESRERAKCYEGVIRAGFDPRAHRVVERSAP